VLAVPIRMFALGTSAGDAPRIVLAFIVIAGGVVVFLGTHRRNSRSS